MHTAASTTRNRWGDPPLLEYQSLSSAAVWAFALSAAPLIVIYVDLLFRARRGDELFELFIAVRIGLFALRVILMFAAMGFAYTALFSLALDHSRCGRGLAWTALILSYALLVWHVGAFAVFFSPVRYVFYAILAVALLHVPIFAAQCAAAKYAVVMAIIGGMLLSLLSCGLLHSREQARRLSCTNQLRQMGLVLQEQSLLGHKPRLPPPVADQSLPGNGTLKLLSSD